MDLGLSGRAALVCGASSGLGLASAEALAGEGANVALFARRGEQLEEHAARLGGIATPRLDELYPDGPTAAHLEEIALRRWGTPREFGDVVCFLASDRARYVTGQTLVVDGGLKRFLF